MPEPLAYLLTWTTYGTWLHGDPRGSVDSTRNTFQTPHLSENPIRLAHVQRKLKANPLVLDGPMRHLVRSTIEEHCIHKSWPLRACNVRTNHVHCVVQSVEAPAKVAASLKAWATRRLRESNLTRMDAPVWTSMASTRWLWDQESLARAMAYVNEGQGTPLDPG